MHSWQKFEPANPAGYAGYFQDAGELFPSGLGWFLNLSKVCAIPTIRLKETGTERALYWIQPDRIMDPKGAKRRMDERILESLSHFIPHDINGKVMGIDGVLEAWKDVKPDADTALDDIRMIRASLDPLRKLTNVFSWVTKDKPEHARVFTLLELYATFAEALPRHFKPLNSLQFKPPQVQNTSTASIMALPHLVSFWFFGIGILLSALKQGGETVTLSFNYTEDHRHLVFYVQCEAFAKFLESQVTENAPEIFWDWLTLLAHQEGTWKNTQNGIEITVPLKGFGNESLAKAFAFGSTTDFDAKDESLYVVSDISASSVARNLNMHMFNFHDAYIGASVDARHRELVVDLVSSIRDIHLDNPSRKLA